MTSSVRVGEIATPDIATSRCFLAAWFCHEIIGIIQLRLIISLQYFPGSADFETLEIGNYLHNNSARPLQRHVDTIDSANAFVGSHNVAIVISHAKE